MRASERCELVERERGPWKIVRITGKRLTSSWDHVYGPDMSTDAKIKVRALPKSSAVELQLDLYHDHDDCCVDLQELDRIIRMLKKAKRAVALCDIQQIMDE